MQCGGGQEQVQDGLTLLKHQHFVCAPMSKIRFRVASKSAKSLLTATLYTNHFGYQAGVTHVLMCAQPQIKYAPAVLAVWNVEAVQVRG